MNYNYGFERTKAASFWNYFLLVFFTALIVGVASPFILKPFVDKNKVLVNDYRIDTPIVDEQNLRISGVSTIATVASGTETIIVKVPLVNFVATGAELELSLIGVYHLATTLELTADYNNFSSWMGLFDQSDFLPTNTTPSANLEFKFKLLATLNETQKTFVSTIGKTGIVNYEFQVTYTGEDKIYSYASNRFTIGLDLIS